MLYHTVECSRAVRVAVSVTLALGCASSTEVTTAMPLRFQSMDAGGGDTCALTASGTAYCWGNNDGGKLGVGPEAGQIAWSPTPLVGGLQVSSISTGFEHICAVTPSGGGLCWGKDYAGSLGMGIELNSTVTTPTLLTGTLTWQAFAASELHSCGLTIAGAAYCWGFGSAGQLGTGSTYRTPTPTPVAGGLVFEMVSSRGGEAEASQQTCGLTTAGQAYCWGGSLPDSGGSGFLNVPFAVPGGLTFTMISAVGGQACGITPSGALYCWGSGSTQPVLVPGSLTWASISVSPTHKCGISQAGVGYCWGLNDYGQIGGGLPPGDPVAEPTPVALTLRFSAITAGNYHSCGLLTDSTAYCWGLAEDGLLGIGELSLHTYPLLYNVPTAVGAPP